MRGRIAWVAVACLLAAGAGPAAAQETVPEGRFALVLGGRENVGSLGEAFGRGWVFGVEAGWQPTRLGASWSLLFGLFESDDPTRVETSLRLLEMQFGPRLRWPLGAGGATEPRFLVVGGGVTLLRSNVPIPPDPGRSYLGPYAGLGIEQLLAGKYMLSFEARYGMFVGGPQGLTVLISLAFGS